MPVMYIHGTTDPIIPFNGGKKFGRLMYSHNEILKKWVTMDGCDPTPVITQIPDNAKDGTTAIKEEYSNPKNTLKVISYTINKGGHTWPGGPQYLPVAVIGRVCRDFSATRLIWEFFHAHPRPGPGQPK